MTDADKVMHPKHEGTKMYHQVSENARLKRRRHLLHVAGNIVHVEQIHVPIRCILSQSWSWVTFSKPNPTQPKISGTNPTQPTKVFTRPNPTHHRHLVWHIRLYRKLYTTAVTRHRQVHSQ